jgi:hypothetical protein
MPHQCILAAAEGAALFAFPIEKSELIRLYRFSEQDLSVIKRRRGDVNGRLNRAAQLGIGEITQQENRPDYSAQFPESEVELVLA